MSTRITFGGRSGRSPEFDAWLKLQPPEARREIERAEKEFLDRRETASLERDYADSMEGYEVAPAGPNVKHRDYRGENVRLRTRS